MINVPYAFCIFTACSQSVILHNALPFSDQSVCGYSSVLRGVEMGYVLRPLHFIHQRSNLISGIFPLAVCPALPIRSISMLLGNDIASGKVTPSLQVLNILPAPHGALVVESRLFPACIITRAQAQKQSTDLKTLFD